MEQTGFIKLSRSILESSVWNDGYDAALFFNCLLRASHNYYGDLKPGQFYSSILGLAKGLGWSRNGAAKHLDRLEQQNLIKVRHETTGIIVTVNNWDVLCQEKAISTPESPARQSVQNAQTYAHDMNTPVHDVNTPIQDMHTPAHDMNADVHDVNARAHDMNYPCSQYEHYQEQYNQEPPRTLQRRINEFEIWWKEYPHHTGKTAAQRAWLALDVPAETLMTALDNAKHSQNWLRENGRFIPSAAKWLDGGWEDYVDQSQSGGAQSWTEY